jgi:hypothetical protein
LKKSLKLKIEPKPPVRWKIQKNFCELLNAKLKFNIRKSSLYNYLAMWKVFQSLEIAPADKGLVTVSALSKLSSYEPFERQGLWDKFVLLKSQL